MRFGFGLCFLALLASVSCSHKMTGTSDSISLSTASEMAEPFIFEPLKRTPSQIVKKPTYHWEADSLKIPVTAGASIDHVYKVKFTHFSEYVTREQVVRMVPTEVVTGWSARNDAVLVCDTEAGAGKSDHWNAFYGATTKNKPQALDNAIHGIGVATAKKLVDEGYFHSKPRNWSEFQAEIKRAEAAKLIEREAAYQILYKHRQENMTKLGYNTQLTGACHMAAGETYYVPVYGIQNVRKVVTEDVPHKDVISTETKNYQIQISGQKLQAFESEMLVFSFDYESNNVSLSSAYYNNYALSFQGNKLIVAGAGRKSVLLPSDVIVPGAVIEASGGMARFSAAFNQKYIPKTAADGHLMVSVRVHSCKQGWISGTCALRRDEQIQTPVVKEPVNGVVKHEFQRVSGRLYWVRYWVNTSGSPWYAKNVVVSSREPTIN